MAKIVATYDTKTKELDVQMNGESLENIVGVEFYKFSDDGHVDLRRVEVNDDESYITITRISASEEKVVSRERESETVVAQLSDEIASNLFPHVRENG